MGGSSGGEGCLISAMGSLIGIGSDIGGSIRLPAVFNGIYGHKPTNGKCLIHYFQCPVFFTKSTRTARLVKFPFLIRLSKCQKKVKHLSLKMTKTQNVIKKNLKILEYISLFFFKRECHDGIVISHLDLMLTVMELKFVIIFLT